MRSLAQLLTQAGWRLSGSDVCHVPAMVLGLPRLTVAHGHAAGNIPGDATEVIHSAAIDPGNPELVAARRRGLAVTSYVDKLAELVRDRELAAVAGTHGKSTSTAMLAEILTRARLDPLVVCGAEPIESDCAGWHQGGRYGCGDLAVLEACEYRRHFLRFRPRWAAVTGIEADHVDCYENLEELVAAFAQFARQVESGGRLLLSADCALSRSIEESAVARVETFSADVEADWQATSLQSVAGRYRFSLVHRGQEQARLQLAVPGRHNVHNALVAAALALCMGAAGKDVIAGLESFRGLRRRLEPIGEHQGVAWWTDYAHHPSEVCAAIETLREVYPGRRITVIFQPHQQSRTRHFFADFVESLCLADRVAICDVYAARERAGGDRPGIARELAAAIGDRGVTTLDEHTLKQILPCIERTCRRGDVVVTMGAGDIAAKYYEYADWIRRRCARGCSA